MVKSVSTWPPAQPNHLEACAACFSTQYLAQPRGQLGARFLWRQSHMFLAMNGRLARANTSAESEEPEAIISSHGRPASSPVPMSSRVDSDGDTLSDDHQDLITSDRVLEIVSLQRDEEPEKEQHDENRRADNNNLSLSEREGHTKTAIRASATSTVSSTASTKSLALPPLTNEQVNKSKFVIGSTSFFVSH